MSLIDQNDAQFFNLGLLIVVPKSRAVEVELRLNNLCGINWEHENQIELLRIDDSNIHNHRDITSRVKQIVSRLNSVEVCVRPVILISEQCVDIEKRISLLTDLRIERIERVPFNLLSTVYLKKYVRVINCTWQNRALKQLKKWTHDDIDFAQVEQWLRQFDLTHRDGRRWVGEFLLQNLCVLSSQDMVRNFFSHDPKVSCDKNNNIAHCFIRYEDGKSADAISQLLKKPAFSLTGFELNPKNWLSALVDNHEYDRVVVYEDGLFTGVELKGILFSLTGQGDGKKEIHALTEAYVQRLSNWPHQFRFCVATDVGTHRLQQAIENLGIKADIITPVQIGTLTKAGVEALKNNCLYQLDDDGKEVISDSETTISKGVFEKLKIDKKRKDAVDYCRTICTALWKSNLTLRNKKSWSEARLNDCSLGAGNMALALAFATSVPKSTLPVFWCHGEVLDRNGKKTIWKPLFKSAHPIISMS